jgi:ABC-type Fe3+-hydroxamate transport system substrate-binding protein
MARARIISLVPSWTETLFAIGAGDRVVGCTRFCEQPRDRVQRLPKVGGTKDVDVGAVLALGPDLVIANQEENTRHAVEALRARGVNVLLTFAHGVRGAIAELRAIGAAVAAAEAADACASRIEQAVSKIEVAATSRPCVAVAVFVWRDPWMVAGPATYIDDLVRLCGGDNVFGTRRRRYPLAADLGRAPERPAGDRDTRYPRITIEEVTRSEPDVVLLPDEPYAFTDRDARDLRAALPRARIVLCSGKDLCWYGARMAEAIPRVAGLFAAR